MSTGDLIHSVFMFMNSLGNFNDDVYSELIMAYDEKLMGYSVSIVSEIIELLEEGYSYDEIKELIMECDYAKTDPELTEEEIAFLRKDALKILNIRYRIYMDEKNTKKRIKK